MIAQEIGKVFPIPEYFCEVAVLFGEVQTRFTPRGKVAKLAEVPMKLCFAAFVAWRLGVKIFDSRRRGVIAPSPLPPRPNYGPLDYLSRLFIQMSAFRVDIVIALTFSC